MASKKRVTVLNLDVSKLDMEALEEIGLAIEDRIRELLDKMMPVSRSYDADIIVYIERKGGEVTISLDIGIMGDLGDVIDYDAVIQRVIREVSKYIEELLRERAGKRD